MLRNVLVPLDGSGFAEAALATATVVARSGDVRLCLLKVHNRVAAISGTGYLAAELPDVEWDALVQDQAYLAHTAAGLSARFGVTAGYREAEGIEGPEICRETSRVGADLVVMATHGRGGIERLRLGSVADYVVRHLGIPILLVHPDRQLVLRTPPTAQRILVALDLSGDSEAILEPVMKLARGLGASLTLVHVAETVFEPPFLTLPISWLPDQELQEAVYNEGRERLNLVAERVRASGLEVDSRVVFGAGPAEALLKLLEGEEFDMVAMTTHGHGGLRRLMMGSVADRVIRAAAKPVLVIRPEL